MTAVEIIEEIKRLPENDKTKVIDFARTMRQLPPEKLRDLAKRMVETSDSAEAEALKDKMMRGFYGDPNA